MRACPTCVISMHYLDTNHCILTIDIMSNPPVQNCNKSPNTQ
jgi:hypothetical protein